MNMDQINSASQGTQEEVDSEAEEEQMTYNKSKFTLNIDYDSTKATAGVVAVVCAGRVSQALFRIIFNDELVQVGVVEANEDSFKKPKEVLKVYAIQNFLLFFEAADMKSQYLGQIVNEIWPSLKNNNCTIVGLSSVFKNNYTTFEGDAIELDESKPLPLRYARSSRPDANIDGFLTNAKNMNLDVQPDTAFNANNRLIAALMMNAEMYGSAAITFKGIMSEHCITTEGLQAYTPVVAGLLGLKDTNMTEIFKLPKFKPVLKELNAYKNGIFN